MEPPQVACRECKCVQAYTGQKECVSCKKELVCIPPWAAAVVANAVFLEGKYYHW